MQKFYLLSNYFHFYQQNKTHWFLQPGQELADLAFHVLQAPQHFLVLAAPVHHSHQLLQSGLLVALLGLQVAPLWKIQHLY